MNKLTLITENLFRIGEVRNMEKDYQETIIQLVCECRGLESQVKKQKEVIDKIEDLLIIKKARCLNEDDYVLNVSDLDDILHLLKEVSE